MVRIGRKTNIRLIVGGIAGYSAGMIKNVTMEKGSKVESAGINHYFLQSCKESYTGGAIGFKDSAAEINSDSNFSINCTVKGTKNVGGLIGYNRNGKITNYVNNAVVKGEENVGGIIGWICNGNIKNCENNANVTRNSGVTSRNIGGIVGYSETSNIEKCKNKGAIKGSQNVGGITGQQKHGGTISLCENIGNVEGKGNNYSYKTTLEYFANDFHTGTGGIAGKLYKCKLTKCYNSGTVTGNKNIGGVVGLTGLSEITYSYNKGDIESTLSFIGSLKGTTGGICGLGATVNVLGCYNIGTVRGFKDFAGIMGVTYGKKNKICYCYNAGTFEKTSYYEPMGILADADLSTGETTVHECYYRKSTIKEPNRYGNAMNDNELKQQLYNWANSLSEPDAGEFMYNTVAPVENSRGYEGYGVLWWEIEGYNKAEFYIGSFYTVKGSTPSTLKYKAIEDKHSTTLKIGEKSVTINDDNKKYLDADGINTELHSWTMRIKDGTYNLTASATNYGKASTDYDINSSTKNKILALLPTGAEKAVLTKSGDATYNWNHTMKQKVPTVYTYKYTPLAEAIVGDGDSYWTKSKYKDKYYPVITKFGNSTEESSDYIAQVFLDGLDGPFNPLSGKTSYSWEYTKYGTRKSITGVNWLSKGDKELGTGTGTSKTNLDSKCTISIPMQSLKNATSDLDLSYDPENCSVSRADLKVEFKCWIDRSLVSELDSTGKVADYVKEHMNYPLKDEITYQASFGGVESGETKQEIKYSFYSDSEHSIDGEFDLDLNVLSSDRVLSGDGNENVNIALSWDAEYLGIHIAISKIEFEVEYSIAVDADGLFKFYDL